MENNFFRENFPNAFETNFWKWLFQWANYEGVSPALEEAARSLLSRIMGEKWQPGFSVEVIANGKVHFLILINQHKAILLNRRSLTLTCRQELMRLRTGLLHGTIPDVIYPIENSEISVVYFEFGLPTAGIRKKLLLNEQVLLEEKLAELRERDNTAEEKIETDEEIDEIYFWDNPVERIIRFYEVYQILQKANEETDNDIFKSYFNLLEEQMEESQRWRSCPVGQWSFEMAKGFAQFLEDRKPEVAWGLEDQSLFRINSEFIPIPEDWEMLGAWMKGLRVGICGNFEDRNWEYIIIAVLQDNKLPFPVLMDIYYQMKQYLSDLGMVWYKKRFLPKASVTIMAAPFTEDRFVEKIEAIGAEIKKLDWARLEKLITVKANETN